MASRNKDLSVKLIINGEDKSGRATSSAKANLATLEQQVTKLQQRFSAFLALSIGQIVSRQIGEVVRTADAYKTLEARLKLVSDSTEEYTKAESALFDMAQRTRSGLEATYNLYGKVETAVKQYGGAQEDALAITETLNKAIALTSQGVAQDAAAVQQFSQALSNGVLRGDEFNSVMENSPGLAQALAEGLDIPITKLRGMAEAGELTADRLINALGKSAPKVAQQFNQLPTTVGQAFTVLNNEFTKFIGQSDKATGASSKLAQGITVFSKNLDKAADVATLALEIYGVKLVAGMAKSAQASYQAAAAARAKAAADELARKTALSLLPGEIALTKAKLEQARVNVEQAGLQAALAVSQKDQAAATKAQAAAFRDYNATGKKLAEQERQLASGMTATAVAASKSEKAVNGLNKVLNVFIAFEIARTVGEWLIQFERVRTAGSYVAEAFQIMLTGAQALTQGLSFEQRFEQIKQIHAEFEQVRAGLTEKALADNERLKQSETAKAQAVEAAAVQQQASFEKIKAAATALTESIDNDTARQTELIRQSLEERLALIETVNKTEAEKDTLKLEAKNQAAEAELRLLNENSARKLQVIDQEYAKELATSTNNKERTVQLENEKRKAKLDVYLGLADRYQLEVNRLGLVYANEVQLAADAKQRILALTQSHEERMFNLSLAGLSEREKITRQQEEFDKAMSDLRRERAAKDGGDQQVINSLLEKAKNLQEGIYSAAITGSADLSKAKENETALFKAQLQPLSDYAKAHEDSASRTKKAQDGVIEKFAEVNKLANNTKSALEQEYALQIGIDEPSLNNARATIADLLKPEIKTIIIETIEKGAGSASASASSAQPGVTVPNINDAAASAAASKQYGLPQSFYDALNPGAATNLNIPTPELPDIPAKGQGREDTIKFVSPDGTEEVSGRFGQDDGRKILKILKDSGGVSYQWGS